MTELTRIWEPLSIGPMTVRNRIMMTPHRQSFAADSVPSERTAAYFAERARGGIGLLSSENASAWSHRDQAYAGPPSWRQTAWETRAIPGFEQVARAIHEHGARYIVQLAAYGANEASRVNDDWAPVRGVSSRPAPRNYEYPAALTKEEIRGLAADFGRSARNMATAGADGVELHSAHGYLGMQFLSPYFNRRSDDYGGTPRKCCAFALQVAGTMREQVGDGVAVGVRLSFDEYIGEAGITPELSEEYLGVLAESGIFDYFSISCGSYYSLHYPIAPMGTVEDGFLLDFGKRAKAVVGDRAKIFIVGRIRDLELAERAVSEGAADMVSMVRAHIADPFLIRKTLEGRADEIIRCSGANECAASAITHRPLYCIQNPSVGREHEWGEGTLRPAERPRRIVVVGGGPAGMKVAGIAAARGHEVLLFEREKRLGGHLQLYKALPARGDWQNVIDNLTYRLERGKVDVVLGVEATARIVDEEEPEAVVVATGATWDVDGFCPGRPDRDSIPGADGGNVLGLAEAIRRAVLDPKALGQRVIVVDDTGGYLPLGLAELLGRSGIEVEVVSRRAVIGEEAAPTQELPFILPRLAKAGVTLSPGHFVERIDGSTVELYQTWNRAPRVVEGVGTIVLALLRSPLAGLLGELQAMNGRELHCIGDAHTPRRTSEAIFEGERLGRAL